MDLWILKNIHFLINQFSFKIHPKKKQSQIMGYVASFMITTISSQKLGVPIHMQHNVCIQNLPEGPPEGPLKGKAGN